MPEEDEAMPPDDADELGRLGTLVERALALADRLRLPRVGIALDVARVDLARVAGEPGEHPTVQ